MAVVHFHCSVLLLSTKMDMFVEDIFLEDDLDVLEILDFGFPRQFRERRNYFEELDDFTFFKRFRLYKGTTLEVLAQIEQHLEYPTDANNSLSPINQLLCCLSFYASNGHLSTVADFMNIDISTVSRVIVRVSEAIASLFPNIVKMPEQESFIAEQNKFYAIARFPRVIGLVDGTHVKVQSPGGDNAEIYRNRKGYFSFNVQVVGNAELKFLDVVARWPGSTHDSTIFANSNIRMRFEANEFNGCILLGDSGYPLRHYFLTPLANPITRQERLYNESLVRTRNAIERQIGLWKRRFPVVAYGTRLKEETVKTIIIATAALHNIARNMNEDEPPFENDVLNIDELNYLIAIGDIPDPPGINYGNIGNGHQIQQNTINYFNNL